MLDGLFNLTNGNRPKTNKGEMNMDLQSILTNAVQQGRAERFKASNQMTLGEMIIKLEAIIEAMKIKEKDRPEYQDPEVQFDFEYLRPTGLSSWRGSYAELAIEFDSQGKWIKASEFLAMLKEAVGKEYTGWKGGEFVMGRSTPMWVANPGNSGNTGVYNISCNGYSVIIETGHCEF